MKLTATLLCSALALSGCGLGGSPSTVSPRVRRPATDTPERFNPPATHAYITPADTLPGSGCLSPLTDPRSGAKLVLHDSANGIGDYSTPPGAYDVRPGELLRVDCNTGKALGIVNR